MIVKIALWIGHALEYLGGSRDEPPANTCWNSASIWWGLWWGFISVLIWTFAGQTSKFIYIDF